MSSNLISISDFAFGNDMDDIDTSEYILIEDEKEYKGYIPYINSKMNHYECFCGKSGEFPAYINKNKFVCDFCGNAHFVVTTSKRGFSIDARELRRFVQDYGLRYNFYKEEGFSKNKPLITNNDMLQSVEFVGEDEDSYLFRCANYTVTIDSDLKTVFKKGYKNYKVSKEDYSFRDMKGKEKPKIVPLNEQGETYKELEKVIVDKLEYPLANYTGCMIYYNIGHHALRLKFLNSKAIYQIYEKNLMDCLMHKDIIRANVNLDGTNIQDILKLPKSLCDIIFSDEFKNSYGVSEYADVLLQNAYKLHKDFGDKNKEIALNTDELRNLYNGLFELLRRWDKVVKAERELEQQVNTVNNYGEIQYTPVNDYYNYNLVISAYELDSLIVSLSKLINYGYNLDRLITYVSSCYEKQGIYLKEFLTLLEDYARMCKHMDLKFDKYPMSIKLNHDIMVKKYRLVKSRVKDEELKKIANRNSYLEVDIKGYTFVVPKTCLDFIKESNVLRHCVSSYTEKVFNGECVIVFMRETKDVTKPFITIEVADGVVKQARGFCDKKPSATATAVIKEWCKKLNLIYATY